MYIRILADLQRQDLMSSSRAVLTPKGPRQKIICSLGDLRPRPRAEWLELAPRLASRSVGPTQFGSGDTEALAVQPEIDAREEETGRLYQMLVERAAMNRHLAELR